MGGRACVVLCQAEPAAADSPVCVQSPTAFDMMPYLLGMKGPAQCVDLSDDDLRVNVFPRDGGQPIVSPFETRACLLCCSLLQSRCA